MSVGDDICATSGIRKEEGDEKEEMFSILITLAVQLFNEWTIDQISG